MPESAGHMERVGAIARWVPTAFSQHANGLYVLADRPESGPSDKPWPVAGFIPDVYAGTTPKSFTLLGEAKWFGDLETARSANQIRTFLDFLSALDNAHFVLATAPQLGPTARRIVRTAVRHTGAFGVTTYLLASSNAAVPFDATR